MIKKLLFLLLISCCTTSIWAQTGHKIAVNVENYEGTEVYLAYRRGKGTYSRDTAAFTNGVAVFESPEKLPGGMYLILFPPENNYFEFLVNEVDQEFEIFTAAPNFAKDVSYTGSKDNAMFVEYKKYLSERSAKSKELKVSLDAATTEKKKEKYIEELDQIAASVRKYQDKYFEDHPEFFSAKLIKLLQEPFIPEPPVNEDGSIDSTFRYRYYKSHFIDDFMWTSPSFVNTHFILDRVDYYLDKLTMQMPDSIKKEVDYLLTKAEQTEEIYKIVLPHLINKYYRPQIMGLDEVFVHLAYEYYAKGKAPWVSEKDRKKIIEEAYMNKGVLIGKKAPDVQVQLWDAAAGDFGDQMMSPYDIEADFTIVFLWKPGCPACKKMTEELKPFYEEYKEKGVEIFSISSAKFNEIEKAKKDIEEKEMPWIITADPKLKARALQSYYGTSLPKIYVLDKDKKIIANRIGASQLADFLQRYQNDHP